MDKFTRIVATVVWAIFALSFTVAFAEAPVETPTITAQADDLSLRDFVIKHVEFEGLERISEGTARTYLPVRENDTFTTKQSTAVIQALYDTGFFSDIRLVRDNDTLIIHLTERPVIGAITVKGNKDIPTDKLTAVLKDIGLAEGRVYDRSVLQRIQQSLQSQYFARGKYNAKVDVTVTAEPRNRVNITIKISEGRVAVIRNINIIGNETFQEKKLLKQLMLSKKGAFTWISGKDQYSKEKLDASLENLRSYYMDRGYIKFKVDSAQVAITPDRKDVYITINFTEGAQYKIEGYQLSGELILPVEELAKLVTIKKDDIFSRKQLLDVSKAITDALGAVGYLFAKVNIEPVIDDTSRFVFVNFNVEPGSRIYVHRIHFFGNDRTNENVLRRSMRQMEGGLVSTEKLEESKWHLQQLSYITDVNRTIERVAGTDNQVDVNYKITEGSPASVNFSVGYSQLDGVILSTGLNHTNFLGAGNSLGFTFTRSNGFENYNINYFNPYYTKNGVSRRISLYYQDTNPSRVNISGSYTTSQYGTDISYGIPINETVGSQSRVSLGYGLSETILQLSSSPSTEVSSFVDNYGRHSKTLHTSIGWSYNGLDRAVFPTKGFHQAVGANVFLPIDRDTIGYYKLSYTSAFYVPVTEHNILNARAVAGFGDAYTKGAQLPFYANYYAGGTGSVRGYEGNTLGPRDSKNDSFGGNFSVSGTLGWIFPNPISNTNLRSTAFVDAGNVYSTYSNHDDGGIDFHELRYSAGIQLDWMSPMGIINFSFTKALNPHREDFTQFFAFSVGTSF